MQIQRTSHGRGHNILKVEFNAVGSGALASGRTNGEAFAVLLDHVIGVAGQCGVPGAVLRDGLNAALETAGYQVRAVL